MSRKFASTERIEAHKGPFKKLCLTSRADQEYIYEPEIGSLKAYEKHDAQFLLHLLLRGERRAHFTQSL